MPYINPLSSVALCRVNGLDPTYKNTLYFPTLSDQFIFFMRSRIPLKNTEAYQLEKENFIKIRKVGQNRVRINQPLSVVSNANYLMIKNEGITEDSAQLVEYDKNYMYAFITDYVYISEDVTEIEFELDVIQTYLFDYEECVCMVEREHTYTDFIGEHIATEPIDTGPMKPVDMEEIALFNNYMIVVATAYTGS